MNLHHLCSQIKTVALSTTAKLIIYSYQQYTINIKHEQVCLVLHNMCVFSHFKILISL